MINLLLGRFTLENFSPSWLWSLLIPASIVLLVVTYRSIWQRSGNRLAWWLLTMRLLGVLALWVAIIKPAWTSQVRRIQPPRVAVILDDSQSMTIHHQAPGLTAEARWSHLRRWLDSRAVRDLKARFDVRFFGMDGRRMDEPPSDPGLEQTDLVRALRSVASAMAGVEGAAVVLVSDGADTTGREDLLSLADYPLPVHGLGFPQPRGGSGETFDLALVSVDGPARTLVHNAVLIKVLVSKDSGAALDVPLVIQRGPAVLHTESISLGEGPVQKLATLTFTPAEAGDFVLSARLSEQRGERTAANNGRLFRLRVEEEPIRVLLVEGTLRLEYTWLHDRLAQDPDVELASLMRSANPTQSGPEQALISGELFTQERLAKIHAICLGDFEHQMLPTEAYASLRKWVEAGGGLLVMGGYRSLDPQGLWQTDLAELLPADPPSQALRQIEDPVQWEVTEAGLGHPALQVSGNRLQDRALWSDLPQLAGATAVGPLRPGATLLARAAGVSPDLVLLAQQPYGKGRVVLLAPDSTWRWSRLTRMQGKPDTKYVRFWSQMVRWLAGREVAAWATALTLTTDEPSYRRSQRVSFRIRRNPAVATPGLDQGQGQVSLTLRTPDGRNVELTPQASPSEPDLWTAGYFPDRGGRYEATARLVSAPGRDAASQVSEFLVAGSDLELDNPAPDPGLLAQVARLTGGIYADLDNEKAVSEILDGLSAQEQVKYEVATTRVWNHPLVLLAFLGLLSAEWFLRRRNRLA